MTAHKHAALMLQYAQDALETETPWERWQIRPEGGTEGWHDCSGRLCFSERCEYRRKPRTLTYTVTIPEPLREAPEVGSIFYAPAPLSEGLTSMSGWHDDDVDYRLLKRGLCFATQEDAIAAAKAMLPIKEAFNER